MTSLLLSVILNTQTMASTCVNTTFDAMKAVSRTPNRELAEYICEGLPERQDRIRAVTIAKLESDFQNVISKSGDDWGYFQVHVGTGRIYGLNMQQLLDDPSLQVAVFSTIMQDKLDQCKHKGLPEACWHSKTPSHYNRYSKNYRRIEAIVKEIIK